MSEPSEASVLDLDARVDGLVEIVDTEKAGRGLIAKFDLDRGQVLFVAPTIRVPKDEYDNHCKFSVFEDYLFHGKSGDYHLCLHLGSIFNHSATPNVNWKLDEKEGTITFTQWTPCKAGDDLFINYGAWGHQYEKKVTGEEGENGEEEDGGNQWEKLMSPDN